MARTVVGLDIGSSGIRAAEFAVGKRTPSLRKYASVELPPGAVPLARTPVCLQAYRLGEFAWGIQFHAEVTQEIVEGWAASDGNGRRFDVAPMERWNQIGRALAGRFLDVAARRPRRARPEATPAS